LELPEISLLQQSILLAVGFDKWIAVSKTGARMKVVDYPRADSGTFIVADVAEAESVAEEMSARFPQLKIRKSGRSGVQVSGRFATMAPAIQALISRQVAIKASSGADRYTVELKGTRGSILATVAQQLNVQLRFESPARPLLEDYIELDIVDATLEEIVQRSLAGTPLTYRLDKSVLAIIK
jgi:hypothetical protein